MSNHIRAYPEDITKIQSIIDGKDILNTPQAIHKIVEKAEKYDQMIEIEECD
jgi:proline dehydrogenase